MIGFNNQLKQLWTAASGTLGEYRFEPDLYHLFFERESKREREEDKEPDKKRKKVAKDTKPKPGGDVSPEKIKELEAKGWLTCKHHTEKPPMLNIKLKQYDDKKPCGPFCFKGYWCPFGKKCRFAHCPSLERAGDEATRKNICKAVEASKSATNPINFVEGKGPKPKGQ